MELFDVLERVIGFIIAKLSLIILIVSIIIGILYFIIRKIKSVGTCPYCKAKLKEKVEFTDSIKSAAGKGNKSRKHTILVCSRCKYKLESDKDISIKIDGNVSSIKLNKNQLLSLASNNYIKIEQYHKHLNGKVVPFDAIFVLSNSESNYLLESYSYKIHDKLQSLSFYNCVCCGGNVVEENRFFKCLSCKIKLNKLDFAFADYNISAQGGIGVDLVTKGYHELEGQTNKCIYLTRTPKSEFYIIKKGEKHEAEKAIHDFKIKQNNKKLEISKYNCKSCGEDIIIKSGEYSCSKCGWRISKSKQKVEIAENKIIEIEFDEDKIKEYLKKGYFRENVTYEKQSPFNKEIILKYSYEAVLTLQENDKNFKIVRVGKIENLIVGQCNKCNSGKIYEYCNNFSCDNLNCQNSLFKTDIFFAENSLFSINRNDVKQYLEGNISQKKLGKDIYKYFQEHNRKNNITINNV